MGIGIGVLQGFIEGMKDVRQTNMELQRQREWLLLQKAFLQQRENEMAGEELRASEEADRRRTQTALPIWDRVNGSLASGNPPKQSDLMMLQQLYSQTPSAMAAPPTFVPPSQQSGPYGAGGAAPAAQDAPGATQAAPQVSPVHEKIKSLLSGGETLEEAGGFFRIHGAGAKETARTIGESFKGSEFEGTPITGITPQEELEATKAELSRAEYAVPGINSNLANSGFVISEIGLRPAKDPDDIDEKAIAELTKDLDPQAAAQVAAKERTGNFEDTPLTPASVKGILESIETWAMTSPEAAADPAVAELLRDKVYNQDLGAWIKSNTEGVGPDRVINVVKADDPSEVAQYGISSRDAVIKAMHQINAYNGMLQSNRRGGINFNIRPPTSDEAVRQAYDEFNKQIAAGSKEQPIGGGLIPGATITPKPPRSRKDIGMHKYFAPAADVFKSMMTYLNELDEELSPSSQALIKEMMKTYPAMTTVLKEQK